jgi:multiple sugar transport system substrate-binding protein
VRKGYARGILIVVLLAGIAGVLGVQALRSQRETDRSGEGPISLTLYRFFGGCSGEYAHVTDLASAVGECGVIQVLTNRFNAEQEGAIVVRTQTAEWSGYYDRLSAAYAARRPPDIAVMNSSVLPGFVSHRLVLPLNQALLQAGVALEDVIESARTGVTFDGEMYALPYDLHGLLWHLNLDLFEKAGLMGERGPVLPSSPEELLVQAGAVQARTGKPYLAIPSQTDPMPTWMFETWVWQQGAQLIGDDGRKATIDSPETRRALDLLALLYERGVANPGQDYAGAEQAFLSGEAAVLVNGTWVVDSYYTQTARPQTGLRRYAPRTVPRLFRTAAAWTDSHVWVLPRQEQHDLRRHEAAVRFLAYLFQHSKAWAKTGHLPARRSVTESADVMRLPGRDGYLSMASIARALPKVERHRAVQDALAQQVNATWLAALPPAVALRRAQDDVQRILATAHRYGVAARAADRPP